MSQEETGWLIEEKTDGGKPRWWAPVSDYNKTKWSEHWTTDASKAVRFARKQDAEAVIAHQGFCTATATEHRWCDY